MDRYRAQLEFGGRLRGGARPPRKGATSILKTREQPQAFSHENDGTFHKRGSPIPRKNSADAPDSRCLDGDGAEASSLQTINRIAVLGGAQKRRPEKSFSFDDLRRVDGDASIDNDPSAGSPTETLLRLLLPLNAQVWKSSRAHARPKSREAQSKCLTKTFNR